MYPTNFVTAEGDRYDVAINVEEGKTRTERGSNEAVGRFGRNVLSTTEGPTTPPDANGVSAGHTYSLDDAVQVLIKCAELTIDDLIRRMAEHHRAGAKRLKKPTLALWGDVDVATGHPEIYVQFGDRIKRPHKDGMTFTWPRASYEELVDVLGRLRPMLCTRLLVTALLQTARPRLLRKYGEGGAA